MFLVIIAVTAVALMALRVYAILPRHAQRRFSSRGRNAPCKLSVFLGSGGHTSEALAMLSGLDPRRYQPREYFVSEGDTLSAQKAVELENSIAATQGLESSTALTKPYRIVVIPRARRVHQSLLTTPASAFVSLLSCIYYVCMNPFLGSSTQETNEHPGVLVLNGPGTCLMLCLAVYFNRFLGLPSPAVIYVESFARVDSLSLSGKLIRPFADRFIVQWPQLTRNGKRVEYRGWLV